MNCKSSIKYAGARMFKCNAGEGCPLCTLKWEVQSIARLLDCKLFPLAGKNEYECARLYHALQEAVTDCADGVI